MLRKALHTAIVLFVSVIPATAQLPQATFDFAPQTHGSVTVPMCRGYLLSGEINGKGPLDIIFDTGGDSILSAKLAARLGLRLEGQGALRGFGAGSTPVRIAIVDTLTIGGLTVHHMPFVILDSIQGNDEFAFIGRQFLRHLAVTFDPAGGDITLSDEKTFQYHGHGTPLPLRQLGDSFLIEGNLDGSTGAFSVDTGDSYSLEVFSPFVQKHSLVQRYHAIYHGYGGSGFGGDDQAFYTRIHTLHIGPQQVHGSIAFLLTDNQGVGANPDIAGNLGQPILDQFTMTFDLPRNMIYLEPNRNHGHPEIFNRAGLILDAVNGNLVVKTVLPATPGARAGIREGDVLLEIDGRGVMQPPGSASLSHPSGEDAFLRPVGTPLHLRLRRGNAYQDVVVKLENIL